MRTVLLGVLCVTAVAVSACMTVPELSDESQISVEAVANRVRCELREAGEAEGWLYTDKWIGSVDLTLEVAHKGAGSGSLGFVVPVHNGTFSLGFTGGPSETATRTVGVSFPFKMAELRDFPCATAEGATDRSLQGSLGLVEWVQRVGSTVRSDPPPWSSVAANWAKAKKAKSKDEKSISYSLRFDLVLEGSVTPSFKIVPAPSHDRTGSFRISGSRNNSHRLDIAMTAGSTKPGEAQERLRERRFLQQLQPFRLLTQ